ncbi:hypothetical protein BJF79_37965 [Actinomadura sp. CNU-125]|uniref:hypothetical protein n=1 Tax=Actinomadura sp. CNU-125 TaxID=1904961 RepID=UPI00095A0D60|nr:hypothetical protein [Actinomadura sp. CNU-125]OLT30874.1 hypothetical protein BJF79_37965 [Actinomadura sp. CNU-125]
MTVGRAAGPSDRLERADAARRLAALAAEPRMSPRAGQLGRLAADLDGETDLERWAAIDLYAAFLRDDTVAEPDEPGRARGAAGAVRDLAPSVLIFMPIMLTWLGLFKATSAYRHSRGDADLAGMSFLEQWQTGFDGRLGGLFYFDRIALGTLLLICLLITVTVAETATRRRSERAAERERARLTRELAAALTAADFHLGRFRLDDASRRRGGGAAAGGRGAGGAPGRDGRGGPAAGDERGRRPRAGRDGPGGAARRGAAEGRRGGPRRHRPDRCRRGGRRQRIDALAAAQGRWRGPPPS